MLAAFETNKTSIGVDLCGFVKPQRTEGLSESFVRVSGSSKWQVLISGHCEKTMKLDTTFEFEELRPDLTRLAYRMLGTRTDADDVLQDAYLRWSNADRDEVRSTRAYLNTIVTRLCIDRKREIDVRKETYVGPWLPEPIVESGSFELEDRIELGETVSLALMHVMETLSPTERAAYLLRKVFDYDYVEISSILEKSEANCRQLVSRAESHIQSERPRFETSSAEIERISNEFLHACETGDLEGLVELLSDDVVIYSDGGGKALAALRPLEGVDKASRFLIGVFKKGLSGADIVRVRVNGQVGFAAFLAGQLATVWVMDVVDGHVRRCFSIRNPDKLARVRVTRTGS
jgi:RNA polymerase sigma-70 factor (ECF subfamily)